MPTPPLPGSQVSIATFSELTVNNFNKYTRIYRRQSIIAGRRWLPLHSLVIDQGGGWGVVCGLCGCGWVVVRRSVVTGGVGRVAPVFQASRVALPPRRLTIVSAVGSRYAHVPSSSSSNVSRTLHVRALLRTAAMPSSPAGVSRTSPLHYTTLTYNETMTHKTA